ncbi:DUF3768 domain-containing protein [Caulobacter vibrioides]|uniref:DUF3768 domain-containing protein n=1 Tax=Caulobacter vibrioides TaxID=155892 RepID=A0A290MY36_CAUVI|nr:DUF3768 domain-containing protein [Caulobacter vibrioides]ATC32534.1 DUF3768 domain-containing protein [Caulobacter vibrioides]
MPENSRSAAIAALNDKLRATPGPGWTVTRGVYALGPDFIAKVVAAVGAFARFEPGDDPYGEHDFGAFELAGKRLFWKIDYYNLDLTDAARDPTNPGQTRRILTVMLAEEY